MQCVIVTSLGEIMNFNESAKTCVICSRIECRENKSVQVTACLGNFSCGSAMPSMAASIEIGVFPNWSCPSRMLELGIVCKKTRANPMKNNCCNSYFSTCVICLLLFAHHFATTCAPICGTIPMFVFSKHVW